MKTMTIKMFNDLRFVRIAAIYVDLVRAFPSGCKSTYDLCGLQFQDDIPILAK